MATPQPTASLRAFPERQSGSLTGVARAVAAIGGLLFLSMVPVTMLVPALKELIGERFHADIFWTHSFMSINMIGAVIVAPIIGILGDRPGLRPRVAAIALATDAVLLASMAFAPSLPWILATRFFEGAAHILALSSLMAIAGGWAADGRRGRTMGIVGASMMFGTAAGTRIGGLVWNLMPDWTFIIAGFLSAVAALGVLLFVREADAPQSAQRRFRHIFAILSLRRELLIPFAYAFMDRLCVGVVITTLVLFLGEVHGIEPNARSKLLVAFLLPFAFLVYPAGRLADSLGRIWPLSLGTIGFGAVFACYGYVPTSMLWCVMILSGVLSAVMFAPSLTLCADLAPPEHRASVYTGFNVFGSLGFILGPMVAGLAFTLFAGPFGRLDAYRFTFILTGALQMLCGLLTLPMLLRLRRGGLTR